MKIKFIILFCLMSFFLNAKMYHSKKFNINNITYNIHYYKNYNSNGLYFFHKLFHKNYNLLYEKYNVKKPVFININLTYSSKIFKYLTGAHWYTAGLYHRERDIFYFQNPSSLRKRKIIQNIIRHEITHHIIHHARENNLNKQNILWLEEAFCESLHPVNLINTKINFKKLKYLKNIDKFSKFLNRNLISVNMFKRKKAYKLAKLWGNYLLNKIGEEKYFIILTAPYENNKFNELYKMFYKKRF